MMGLALSGGGFRATLFHLGSLWRLNEVGMLPKMDAITSVSGGSIVSAYLGVKWSKLTFDTNGISTNFEEMIAKPIMDFCSRTIDVCTILLGIISPFHHPSDLLISKYKKYLYGNQTLQDLPSHGRGPLFTIYTTSMQTGVSVRFTKSYLGEYHLGTIANPNIKIAHAVAASSGFPPPLCPVKLKIDKELWQRTTISDLFDDDELKSTLYMVDGGVYDNLGLEHLTKNCDIIFVSDAGAPFPIGRKIPGSRISMIMRTKRTLDIISKQTRALRVRNLIENYKSGTFKGAYWGIGTNIDEYPLQSQKLDPPLTNDNKITESLAEMRTRLNRFTPEEQGRLINWGYALTDAALRSRYDKNIAPATQFPLLDYTIKSTELRDSEK
ncbi:MAG: patatin-like phospholipase family protein [bacterium]